ncbi:pneumococcal serine-rich repeat protein-like [Procambarus clarkii]|uniref:pneumococcal serine-rich repeat protein-like n=1 Tax=Procambarus clarkii TaxID=6728 RepID=UPI0037449E4B
MATEKTGRHLKGLQNHLSRLLDKCDNCLGTNSIDVFRLKISTKVASQKYDQVKDTIESYRIILLVSNTDQDELSLIESDLADYEDIIQDKLDHYNKVLATQNVPDWLEHFCSRPIPKQAPSSDEIHELPQNDGNPLNNTDPYTGSTTEVKPSFSTISSNTTSHNNSFTESDKFSDISSQYSLDSINSIHEATELNSLSQEPREISEAADGTPSDSEPENEDNAESAAAAVIKAEAKQEASSNTTSGSDDVWPEPKHSQRSSSAWADVGDFDACGSAGDGGVAPVALHTTVTAEVHFPEDASAGVSASTSDMVSAVPASASGSDDVWPEPKHSQRSSSAWADVGDFDACGSAGDGGVVPVALHTTVTVEVHFPEDASAGVSASTSDMVSAVPASGASPALDGSGSSWGVVPPAEVRGERSGLVLLLKKTAHSGSSVTPSSIPVSSTAVSTPIPSPAISSVSPAVSVEALPSRRLSPAPVRTATRPSRQPSHASSKDVACAPQPCYVTCVVPPVVEAAAVLHRASVRPAGGTRVFGSPSGSNDLRPEPKRSRRSSSAWADFGELGDCGSLGVDDVEPDVSLSPRLVVAEVHVPADAGAQVSGVPSIPSPPGNSPQWEVVAPAPRDGVVAGAGPGLVVTLRKDARRPGSLQSSGGVPVAAGAPVVVSYVQPPLVRVCVGDLGDVLPASVMPPSHWSAIAELLLNDEPGEFHGGGVPLM